MKTFNKALDFSLDNPKLTLLFSFVLTAICAIGLTKIVKNTSVDAFIPQDHHSILSRNKIEELFGLQDPIIISIENKTNGVFSFETLKALGKIHESVLALDNVKADGVKSLASESIITGSEEGLEVLKLFDGKFSLNYDVATSKKYALSMPPFQGTLLSYDLNSTAIVIELKDPELADKTYQQILEVTKEKEENDINIYVAGQGATGGYLSKYIDSDSRRMQPIVVITIIFLLFLAFRRIKALLAPLFVIIASAVSAIGLMGYLGIHYYAITSALPVVIVAIAVADSIHLLTSYYELKTKSKDRTDREIVRDAVFDMYKPISLTSVTTIAGFVGLSAASIMPPVTYFGIFAAAGVALAWCFSLFVLPALIVVLNIKPSPIFRKQKDSTGNLVGRLLTRISLNSIRHPIVSTSIILVLVGVSLAGAINLRVDREQVDNFKIGEPIRIAHENLNEAYAGTAYIDILFKTQKVDGLLDANAFKQAIEFQKFLSSIDEVSKTISIVDYLRVLHEAINSETEKFPTDSDTIAQYLLLYESGADASDFGEEIDNRYQHMLIRCYMKSQVFTKEKSVVEKIQMYVKENFRSKELEVEIGGRVYVDYHWMTRLGQSHFLSIGVSLFLIFLISSLLFRSPLAGFVTLAPVVFSVLVVYGYMGWTGIYLEPATSMFAAIAIGVGVDFSIHFIERLKLEGAHSSIENSVVKRFPNAARACFFNASALALGFATLLTSELPTLQRFGLMITIACLTSFFAALIIVPLAFKLINKPARETKWIKSASSYILLFTFLAYTGGAKGKEENPGLKVAQKVWERNEPSSITREIEMLIIDHKGEERKRLATVYRKNSEGSKKTKFRFQSPRRVKNMTYLMHQNSTGDDSQWVFLPALRKHKRIPTSERGASFLGTEFSYEDVKSNFKFPLHEYDFTLVEDSKEFSVISAKPKTLELASELGHSRLTAYIHNESNLPLKVIFHDGRGDTVKTIEILRFEKIDNFWMPLEVRVDNVVEKRASVFTYLNLNMRSLSDDKIFELSNIGK